MEKLATSYAIRLEKCKSNDDLALICAEITIDLMDEPKFMEWREWLLDMTDTTWHTLNDKETPFENALNAEGKKWAKKEGLI